MPVRYQADNDLRRVYVTALRRLEPAIDCRPRMPWPRRPCGYNESMAETPPPDNFEACLGELEKVVLELESGDLPLERSLELFEKGMNLSETCRKQLQDAETRVEMLVRKEGKIQPEPFKPEKS